MHLSVWYHSFHTTCRPRGSIFSTTPLVHCPFPNTNAFREILRKLAEVEPPIKGIADLRGRNSTDTFTFACDSLDLDGRDNPLTTFIASKVGEESTHLFEYPVHWSCSLFVACESTEQSFLVYLKNGDVADHAELPPFRGRQNKEKFEELLKQELSRSRHKYQDEIEGDIFHPVCQALVLNPIQEISSIRFTLKRVCEEMGMEPIQPVVTSSGCAHIFKHSDRAKTEFPDFPPNLRAAISLARFAQDPLLELCSMWSLETHDPAAELLKLNLHPRWEEVPKHVLVTALERELVSAVNKIGVNINYIARQEHQARQSVLQFVSGLGPRKAKMALTELSKIAVDTTLMNEMSDLESLTDRDGQSIKIRNRNQLQALFPCFVATKGIKRGDKVRVKYVGDSDNNYGVYYDGIIAEVNDDGTYDITDQTGAIENGIPEARVSARGGGVVFRNAIGFINVDAYVQVSEHALDRNVTKLIAKLHGIDSASLTEGTTLSLTGDDLDSELFRVEKIEHVDSDTARCKLSAVSDEGEQVDQWYIVELPSALAWPEPDVDDALEGFSSFFSAEKFYSCSLDNKNYVDEDDEDSQQIASLEQNYLAKCCPLDNTRIHPEHYEAAFTIVKSALGCDLENVVTHNQAVFKKFATLDDTFFSFAKAKR